MYSRVAGYELIGREDELRQITRLLNEVRAGRLTVLVLDGPSGSGRTRLLDETARLARRRGVTVFAEPEWAGAGGSRQLLRTVGENPGVLLFVGDDPGRIDPRSWTVLDLLAETAPVLVAITGPAGGALRPAEVHRVRVTPLPVAAQAEFVARMFGARPDPALMNLCRVAAGRPAALRELLAGLDEERLVRIENGRAVLPVSRLPQRMETYLRRRLAAMSVPARHLVRAAATIGVSVPLPRLSRLIGATPRSALDEAVESGLLAPVGDLLVFRHELVRAAVEATLPRVLPAPVAPRVRKQVDWDLLSARESEIAELVGQALTNRQIAGRAGISPHTVNFHLRHIFQKFGIASRVELAALLHRRAAAGGPEAAPPSS
ncbi:MAG TPA: LuxR C-terminal-related transcriptional regulator [Actinoplanes sp.]|nr:LuxR C-terminal-related transcriptional regulator [Actinoplanes sp.]